MRTSAWEFSLTVNFRQILRMKNTGLDSLLFHSSGLIFTWKQPDSGMHSLDSAWRRVLNISGDESVGGKTSVSGQF